MAGNGLETALPSLATFPWLWPERQTDSSCLWSWLLSTFLLRVLQISSILMLNRSAIVEVRRRSSIPGVEQGAIGSGAAQSP